MACVKLQAAHAKKEYVSCFLHVHGYAGQLKGPIAMALHFAETKLIPMHELHVEYDQRDALLRRQ